jgi:hypothetical protein
MRITINGEKRYFPTEFKQLTVNQFGALCDTLHEKHTITDKDIFRIFADMSSEDYDRTLSKETGAVLSRLNWLDTFTADMKALLDKQSKVFYLHGKRMNYGNFSGSSVSNGNLAVLDQVSKTPELAARVVKLTSEIIRGDDSLEKWLGEQYAVDVLPTFNFFLGKLNRSRTSFTKQSLRRIHSLRTQTQN